MEYKVYPENELLCLTPEHKLDDWIQLMHKMAAEGNKIKLYADTETTGLDYSTRGRPAYDPVIDKNKLRKDAATFNIPFYDLEREAKSLSGKPDRMVEIAFVACYTNKDGQTFPLKDADGEQVYFHEMISPYKGVNVPDSKKMSHMPLVAYEIHKTSFEFLKGNEVHPFLDIQLPHEAPGTLDVFRKIRQMFEYEDDKIFDNIIVLFHNANGFDVPFIDSEIAKLGDEFAGVAFRDYALTYDTLDLIKLLLPTTIQKLIAFCQWDENYGGDSRIKDDKEVAIGNTSKSLDNLIRVARFLPNLDIQKAFDHQVEKQEDFANKIKSLALKNNCKLWDSVLSYFDNPSIEIDLSEGADKDFVKDNKRVFDDYKKYKDALKGFNSHIEEAKKCGQLYENLFTINSNIKDNNDLRENVKCINEISRDSHGAKVDSMLFMYAFTIIENVLYKNQQRKIERSFDNLPIQLPQSALDVIKKKSEPKIVDSESTKQAVMMLSQKYDENTSEKLNKVKVRP